MPRIVELTEPGPLAETFDIAAVTVRYSGFQSSRFNLTAPELQAIVQQAYDNHGIIATPSYSQEAKGRRIEDARDVSDQGDYLDASQTSIEDFLDGECEGSERCRAATHIHGCFRSGGAR